MVSSLELSSKEADLRVRSNKKVKTVIGGHGSSDHDVLCQPLNSSEAEGRRKGSYRDMVTSAFSPW
uniref:Uncharacterized protein n=1 Tax=Rhizophora mucronata TaxID=61149 RepID=A0A2P2NFQ8_RHIMU